MAKYQVHKCLFGFISIYVYPYRMNYKNAVKYCEKFDRYRSGLQKLFVKHKARLS